MRRVLPLLLLAFLMCQCDSQNSKNKPNENKTEQTKTSEDPTTQAKPKEKSLSDQYPEKFTEDYIGVRTLTLADKLCNCDPSNAYAFNNVFTNEYGELLKEALALPEGIDGDGPSAWEWIELAGELCTLNAATEINVTDNKAKVVWEGEDGRDEVSLSFTDGEWLIDDLGNCSKMYLKNKIKEFRKYYKSINWLDYIHELEERGYDKDDAVEASDNLQKQIETYFEYYPDK